VKFWNAFCLFATFVLGTELIKSVFYEGFVCFEGLV